jgi:hypothetical protein
MKTSSASDLPVWLAGSTRNSRSTRADCTALGRNGGVTTTNAASNQWARSHVRRSGASARRTMNSAAKTSQIRWAAAAVLGLFAVVDIAVWLLERRQQKPSDTTKAR